MDRHCVNSTAADQYAQRAGQQDDIELVIERLEIEWFDELEHCLKKSSNPILVEFIDRFRDQIGSLLSEMARDYIKRLPEL
ncbi:hypothetical protein [Endozoicomonas atrinae]|uniref:hypothetical protein n=1 Tax=Endozoicomonas atrinae TaxID=1333660 RepID=UPI0008265E6C|nr:hypothetical protein [Endozoicomonas atrinae]